MNILISNDDGISTEGIKALVKTMSRLGDVYVVAPHTQRSASSHALSVHSLLTVKQVEFEGARLAYECDGTPADCVKLGIDLLKRQGINTDIVYTGINHGGNLGTDTMYSGTVSAAAEGMMAGLPAVAVSVNGHQATHFEGACELAARVFPHALEMKGRRWVISINTPDVEKSLIKGVKTARMGILEYDQWFEEAGGEDGKEVFRYRGEPAELDPETEETDMRLVREGFATIAAVKYDLNDYEGLEKIKEWEITI